MQARPTLLPAPWFDRRIGASTSLTVVRWSDVVLFYALVFFLAACVAALAGFNDIAPGIAGIARLISYGFLALALITLVLGIPRR